MMIRKTMKTGREGMVDRENTNSEEHEQKCERDIVANWNIPVREKKKRIKKKPSANPITIGRREAFCP